ncbi:hypothetical protein [Arthrobacter sp. M4]|uniref:hypothetical protein n=1 Tax=Arthrobacter sp. M4 TaxID=218160 RepID=UPI001CDD1709|nr:hypothetical protein [Arthrobacter sp. M4]MCA4132286.1 hypothetical protein [Arthrobacter sp. M4]
MMSQFLAYMGISLGASLVVGFLSAILQGVMAVPVARSVLNRTTRFKMMWSLAKGRIWTLAGIGALMILGYTALAAVGVGLAIVLAMAAGAAGFFFAFIVGLGLLALGAWLFIKVSVAPAAAVVEDIGAVQALTRSWNLTRFNWWRILGITVVAAILVGVISQVVMIPIQFGMQMIVLTVAPHGGLNEAMAGITAVTLAGLAVGALVGALGFAFQTSVSSLLYMDLRMRHEGLDVELLRLLETGADPDGIPGRFGAPAR